jgi:hypothetical protein
VVVTALGLAAVPAPVVVTGLDVPVPGVVGGVPVVPGLVPGVVPGLVGTAVVVGLRAAAAVVVARRDGARDGLVVVRSVVAAGGERVGGPAGQDQDGHGGQDGCLPHVCTFRGVRPLSARPGASHHRTVVLGPGESGHRLQ